MTLKEQFMKENPKHVIHYRNHRILNQNEYNLWLEGKLLIALKDIEELKNGDNVG